MAQLPDEPSVTLRLTHPPRPLRGQLHEVLQAHPGFRSDERIGEALRQSFHDTNDKFIANDPESADPEHGGAAASCRGRPPRLTTPRPCPRPVLARAQDAPTQS